FQAEDGIRDATVTGVQTCALPISFAAIIRPRLSTHESRIVMSQAEPTLQPTMLPRTTARLIPPWLLVVIAIISVQCGAAVAKQRSEERRVGTTCRGRASALE